MQNVFILFSLLEPDVVRGRHDLRRHQRGLADLAGLAADAHSEGVRAERQEAILHREATAAGADLPDNDETEVCTGGHGNALLVLAGQKLIYSLFHVKLHKHHILLLYFGSSGPQSPEIREKQFYFISDFCFGAISQFAGNSKYKYVL